MSVLPLDKDLFVLAPIRRIVWTSDQTEFVVVHFPCVVSVHAQFMTTCMTQDFQVCVVRVKTRSSPCHPCLHLRTHLHPLACTWAFNFCLPIPQPHLHLRLRCRSTNTAKIHKMKSVAQWPIQPPLQVMSPTWSTTSTTQRLTQRSSRINPSTSTRNRRTRSMRNSTMSSLEKRYLLNCSLRSEKRIREPETNLSPSWRKFVTSPVLFHTNKHGETRIRTKGRIAEKSRVKGRGTLKKKIVWRLWGSNFILPRLECQDSLHPWLQRREVHQMLRLTTSTPGTRWLHHCAFRSEKQVRPCCRFITHKEKACFNVHSQFLASTGNTSLGCHKSANLTKS